MRLADGALALSLAVPLGCGRAPSAGSSNRDVPASAWRYEVSPDEALGSMEVSVCFVGAAPRELRPGRDEAASRLLHAHWQGPGARRRLRVIDGRIQLDGAPPDGCMSYGVSLTEGGSLRAAVRRVGRDLLASPSVWLWRPERRSADARATLSLRLPKGMEASLPWPELRGLRVLDARAFRFESYAAFGRFERAVEEHAGVRVELARLDGPLAIDDAEARAWLRSAIDVAAQSAGRFPRARLTAIVVPSGESHEAVPFGMIARGGDASVLLLVSRTASAASLARDWVLPHELSHLLLPFVEREHAWLSEGLATYYQEVLRTRAGRQSEREALRRMLGALQEAADAGRTSSLTQESADMQVSHAYGRVYWGGAALFFQADVALRAQSGGRLTLDAVLARLREDPRAEEVWEPAALMRELDALSGTELFSAMLREAETQPLPDLTTVLSQLGVRVAGGEVSLDEAAPLSGLRRALFAPRPRAPAPPARAALP